MTHASQIQGLISPYVVSTPQKQFGFQSPRILLWPSALSGAFTLRNQPELPAMSRRQRAVASEESIRRAIFRTRRPAQRRTAPDAVVLHARRPAKIEKCLISGTICLK
jgi:hypothetical protein